MAQNADASEFLRDKTGEIKRSGIEAFLDGKKSVTEEELQEFVAGSQPQISEQMSGEDIDLQYDGSKRAYKPSLVFFIFLPQNDKIFALGLLYCLG